MKAAGFIFDTPWGKSLRFYDIIKEVNNSVLIFLRYGFCPLFQSWNHRGILPIPITVKTWAICLTIILYRGKYGNHIYRSTSALVLGISSGITSMVIVDAYPFSRSRVSIAG